MPDLTEEQRSELPKNVITRALGMQDQVVVDLQHDDPRNGDVYVLCSDGLSGMVTDEEILKIVQSSNDIREACTSLIAKANEHGGEDNVTAVLIKIEGQEPDAPTEEIASLARAKTIRQPAAEGGGEDEDDDVGGDEATSPGLPGLDGGNKPKK
jgi:protein phosphatase